MGVHIGSSPLIICRYLPLKILSNDLVLLIQGRIRDSCVGNNRLLVPFNVIWPITRDSRHTELVYPGDGDLITGGVDWLDLKMFYWLMRIHPTRIGIVHARPSWIFDPQSSMTTTAKHLEGSED